MTTTQAALSIGKVAKLTGLSTHTIRKWEERYQAVEPQRSRGGDRRYPQDQVERLQLLRELSTAGAAISDIAPLPTAQLRQLAEEQRLEGHNIGNAEQSPRRAIGVVGRSLPALLLSNQIHMPALQFVPFDAEADPLDAPGNECVDALIVELPLLDETTQQTLADLRARSGIEKLVVVYSFATQAHAIALSDHHTACVRSPINYPELQRTVLAMSTGVTAQATAPGAPPRYSKEVLARIAALPASIVCECPRHLAELIVAMTDFEAYSADCENRNPADAAIHAYLKQTTAEARGAFEQALQAVADHEGLVLT